MEDVTAASGETRIRERTMHHSDEQVELRMSAPRRRELVAMLCQALNEKFCHRDGWERGRELRHWQVTADRFEDMPGKVIEAVFNEWADSEQRLDEIEFSGYLDTDDGHRAWGFVAVCVTGSNGVAPPILQGVELQERDGGYELRASIRRNTQPGNTSAHE